MSKLLIQFIICQLKGDAKAMNVVGNLGEVLVRSKTLTERRDKELIRSFYEWCHVDPFVVNKVSLYWAEIIKELQKERGLNLNELSEVCNVNLDRMRRILDGDIRTSVTVKMLLDALECDEKEVQKIVDQIHPKDYACT